MEENKIEICLSHIIIKDLNENVYPIVDINRTIGNLIFTKTPTIEVSDIARLLHKNEVPKVTNEELNEIIQILVHNKYYLPWVHEQIIQYFTEKLTELQNNLKQQ